MGTLSGSGNYPFPPGSSGGGGGGSIDFTKLNRTNSKSIRLERSTDMVIPAGWFYCSIYHSGIDGPIQVNGKDIHAQGNWNGRDFIDWAAKKLELGEQLTIVSNSQTYVVQVAYPTSSAVDVTTL